MPGVCLCLKEIDLFPSSSTAPKSEILGMHIPATQEMSMAISYIAFDCTNQSFATLHRFIGLSDGSLRQVDVDNNFYKVAENTVRHGTFKEVCHRTRTGFPSDSNIFIIVASVKDSMRKMQEKHRR